MTPASIPKLITKHLPVGAKNDNGVKWIVLAHLRLVPIALILGCSSYTHAEISVNTDSVGNAGKELVDPAWHISPAVGMLVGLEDENWHKGTAFLVDVDRPSTGTRPVKSNTVVLTSHQLQFRDWDWISDAAAKPYYLKLTLATTGPHGYVDVVVPLARARSYSTSQTDPLNIDYAVAQLSYRISDEMLDQPIPVIASRQPEASSGLDAWVVGYGGGYCERRLLDNGGEIFGNWHAGVKRAGSFTWPGPRKRLFGLISYSRIVFDGNEEIALCGDDSGAPLLLSQDPETFAGFDIGADGDRQFKLGSVVGVAVSGGSFDPDAESWRETVIADLTQVHGQLETQAHTWNDTYQTAELPVIEKLEECRELSECLLTLTTKEVCDHTRTWLLQFCKQYDNMQTACQSHRLCRWPGFGPCLPRLNPLAPSDLADCNIY